MKQIASIFLLLSLLAQTFHQAVIVGDYYSNTAAYAKNCINKALPQMHCNGKCQMMKKLKAQEENKDKQNPERRGTFDEVISSKSFFLVLQCFRSVTNIQYADYTSAKPQDQSTEFFHPPGA